MARLFGSRAKFIEKKSCGPQKKLFKQNLVSFFILSPKETYFICLLTKFSPKTKWCLNKVYKGHKISLVGRTRPASLTLAMSVI